MGVRRVVLAVLAWSITALAWAEGGQGGWVVVDHDRGITMSKRAQPGLELDAFRGEGSVQGNIMQVFASMLEIRSVHLWAYGIDEARLIKHVDGNTDIIYLYSDIPWPVRDRDMIVRRDIEVVRPGEEYRIHLSCEPDREPEREGIVRVRTCTSCFRLRKKDASTTEVDYAMSLDPGGNLPSWVAGWVSKNVPFKTLVAIEERAAATSGQYEAVMRRWSAPM